MKKLLLASAMLMGMVGFAFAQEGSKAVKQKKHVLTLIPNNTEAIAAEQKKAAGVAAEKKKANDALIQQKIAADKTGTPIQQPLRMRTKTAATATKSKN
jgi:hypothetical protein